MVQKGGPSPWLDGQWKILLILIEHGGPAIGAVIPHVWGKYTEDQVTYLLETYESDYLQTVRPHLYANLGEESLNLLKVVDESLGYAVFRN